MILSLLLSTAMLVQLSQEMTELVSSATTSPLAVAAAASWRSSQEPTSMVVAAYDTPLLLKRRSESREKADEAAGDFIAVPVAGCR